MVRIIAPTILPTDMPAILAPLRPATKKKKVSWLGKLELALRGYIQVNVYTTRSINWYKPV